MNDPVEKWRGSIRVALAILVLAVASGWAAPPNAGRLADASAQLRSAVAASGSAVAAELEAAGEADRARQMRDAWAVPDRSAVAISQYSDAVAGVVKSGSEGGDTVRKRNVAAGSSAGFTSSQ